MHNIVLLTIDCLRAGSLGCLGNNRRLSPHIDRLASESAICDRTFATGPRTTESFPAILASTYPLSFGATFDLPAYLHTLADALKRQGYETAAFHSNPFLLSDFGFGRGFAHYWDSHHTTSATSKVAARVGRRLDPDSGLYRFLRRLIRRFEAEAGAAYYVRAEEVNRRALQWLVRAARPFFLWLHYMDMHYPFNPPDRFIRQLRPEGIPRHLQAQLMVRTIEEPEAVTAKEAQIYRDLYDAGLLYVDDQVGQLLETLRQTQVLQETLVILTADHGEEFREHGDFGHGADIHLPGAGAARIKLYDELLHVPLIVHAPGLGVTPRNIGSLASLVDLGPTVVDLLGLQPVDQWQGLSLAPVIRGEVDGIRQEVFSEYMVRDPAGWKPIVSCRTERWKFIHDGAFGHHELYDLEVDPAEQRNLYHPGNSALTGLEQRVLKHLTLARPGSDPPTEVEIDPEVAERLRGLGYLG